MDGERDQASAPIGAQVSERHLASSDTLPPDVIDMLEHAMPQRGSGVQ
ncbi:hypothetical protein [Roseivivax lentus]|nr:hypothetical protein [Roseivivax lentus]